jgi:predicted acylesterase/phospholipase RssA
MTIKHLVISGGGPSGFLTYGAISHLAKQGVWSLADIESIHGTSIGAYLGVVVSLNYEWSWLDDYFIKRPWEKVIANSTNHLIDIYALKGLINDNFFIEGIKPLLSARDLKMDITLEEFYEFNHINIHLYTIDINAAGLEKVDISHITHPKLSLVKALQMTMSVPIVFHPVCDEETHACYIDGGFINNFPLNDCITYEQCEHDEILAFKNIWSDKQKSINDKSSILDFLLILMNKLISALSTETKQIEIKNTINCVMDGLDDFDKWLEALSSEELRAKSIERGRAFAGGFHPPTPGGCAQLG